MASSLLTPAAAAFTFMLLSLLLGSAEQVSGLRHVPKSHKTTTDVKHPEFLVTIEPKPTILIPGVGRFLLPPKCKKPFFPYNPVTGAPLTGGSIGGEIPSYGGGGGQGGGTHTQLPGGDDTLVPNPGYETPTPSTGAGAGTTGGQVPPVPLP
ncbi:putative cell wall protein [Hirschfeldia incana]|nr:putative cell wall protein [Hirschfeldia incana]